MLFVGYQSEGTVGRRIINGEPYVRLFGEEIAVNAEICSLHGTSGHADQKGLLNWLEGFTVKPSTVFVNHGDHTACEIFKNILISKGYQADAPYSGTEYDLTTGKMTIYTDGKPVEQAKAFKTDSRAKIVYNELVAAAEELLALAKTRRGKTNKDNAKLTGQIRSSMEKWKD